LGTISWTADTVEEDAALRELSKVATQKGVICDTAERYGSELGPPFDRWPFGTPGRCEEILGELSRNASPQGGSTVVGTKFTPTPWRNSAADVVSACEASRRRLGVEQIDLYQIHHPDIVQPFRKFGFSQPKDDQLLEGLAECVNRGLAKNVGVCNYGPTLLERAEQVLATHGVRLASNQINFSLLYLRQGVMPTIRACHEKGIAVLAYWPLAMGLLTGASQLSAPGRRGVDLQRYLTGGGTIPQSGVQPLVAVMRDVGARHDKTCSQVALNWVICKGVVPIPGARTAARFKEYLGALGWRLSDAEIGELDAAADALPFDFEGAGFRFSNAKFVGYGVEKWYLD